MGKGIVTSLRAHGSHITIGTIVGIISFLLSFGIATGKYQQEFDTMQKEHSALDAEAKKIPILETEIANMKGNILEIKGSVSRIETLLLNRR